jgi:hypothetical protein
MVKIPRSGREIVRHLATAQRFRAYEGGALGAGVASPPIARVGRERGWSRNPEEKAAATP